MIGGEVAADLGAGVDGEAAPHFALFVEETETQVTLRVGHVAVAAVLEDEGTETGAIVGGIEHRSSRKLKLICSEEVRAKEWRGGKVWQWVVEVLSTL